MFADPEDSSSVSFVETVQLSQSFYTQLRRHPVPVEDAAIRAINRHSIALDIYCWLAYRLHAPKALTYLLASSPGTVRGWNRPSTKFSSPLFGEPGPCVGGLSGRARRCWAARADTPPVKRWLCCNPLARCTTARGPVSEPVTPLRARVRANKLDRLGQDRRAETEGALDDAGLAADVRVMLKIDAWPLRSARITSKPLIVA